MTIKDGDLEKKKRAFTAVWNKKLTVKDLIALPFLFLVDSMKLVHDLGQSVGGEHWQRIPFEEVKGYLDKLQRGHHSVLNTFYGSNKKGLFLVEKDVIKFNLSSDWWRRLANFKFRFFSAPKKWDGWWTVVVFDIPENQRKTRDYLRGVLKRLGFAQLQLSTWVTIAEVEKFLEEIIAEFKLKPYLFVFRAKSLFLSEDKKLLRGLFLPADLETDYKRFIFKSELAIKKCDPKLKERLLKELPFLISRDNGVPDEFFSNSAIRMKVWQIVKKLIS